jgi:hypothetical protein
MQQTGLIKTLKNYWLAFGEWLGNGWRYTFICCLGKQVGRALKLSIEASGNAVLNSFWIFLYAAAYHFVYKAAAINITILPDICYHQWIPIAIITYALGVIKYPKSFNKKEEVGYWQMLYEKHCSDGNRVYATYAEKKLNEAKIYQQYVEKRSRKLLWNRTKWILTIIIMALCYIWYAG